MFKDLDGKVVVLTGGNGLIGRQVAQSFLKAGAHLVNWDLKDPLFPVDITNESSVESAVARCMEKWGKIDVLINNAAMNPSPHDSEAAKSFSPYEHYPLDLWEKEIKVGLTGTFLCSKSVTAVMKNQKSGSIVNVGSTYGMVGPDHSIYEKGMFKSIAYASVKGAMPNFTRAWASYAGAFGVRVNCLVPGGVENGQSAAFIENYSKKTALGRMARSDDYNESFLFLASSASSYMTGQTLVVDGGWTAI